MKIETKFNIGNVVWYMLDNKACYMTITSVHASMYEDTLEVGYENGMAFCIDESRLFSSKKELLESL